MHCDHQPARDSHRQKNRPWARGRMCGLLQGGDVAEHAKTYRRRFTPCLIGDFVRKQIAGRTLKSNVTTNTPLLDNELRILAPGNLADPSSVCEVQRMRLLLWQVRRVAGTGSGCSIRSTIKPVSRYAFRSSWVTLRLRSKPLESILPV